MSIREQFDILERTSSHSWSSDPLIGWDLTELLGPSKTCYRRQVKIHETSTRLKNNTPTWFPLAREVPIYFCNRSGDVMVPAHQSEPAFSLGKKNLTANMHVIRKMLCAKPNCNDYHFDLARPLTWELPRHLEECRGVQCLRSHSEHRCPRSVETCSPESTGAIVFGAKDSKLWNIIDALDGLGI